MNFMPEVHTPQVFRQHTKILVKYIVFLENQHAQGKTYISNYGIKAINYNKLASPIGSPPSAPLCIAKRSFTFTFIGRNTEFYIPNRRQFSIDLKNKVNINIQGQIPLSK